jgi:hypothetical protein
MSGNSEGWLQKRLTNWKTPVRWGFLSILVTTITFLFVVALGFYTINISSSNIFSPYWNWSSVLALIFLAFGFIILIITIILAVGWFIYPDEGINFGSNQPSNNNSPINMSISFTGNIERMNSDQLNTVRYLADKAQAQLPREK